MCKLLLCSFGHFHHHPVIVWCHHRHGLLQAFKPSFFVSCFSCDVCSTSLFACFLTSGGSRRFNSSCVGKIVPATKLVGSFCFFFCVCVSACDVGMLVVSSCSVGACRRQNKGAAMLGHVWFLLNLEAEEEPNSGSPYQTGGILINPQHRPQQLEPIYLKHFFLTSMIASQVALPRWMRILSNFIRSLKRWRSLLLGLHWNWYQRGTETSHVVGSHLVWSSGDFSIVMFGRWEVFANPDQAILSELPLFSIFLTAEGDFIFYFMFDINSISPRPVPLLLCWTSAMVVAPLMTMKRRKDRRGEIWCLGWFEFAPSLHFFPLALGKNGPIRAKENNMCIDCIDILTGVSINGGSPKWLVYNGQSLFYMDDLGVPPISENLHMYYVSTHHIL